MLNENTKDVAEVLTLNSSLLPDQTVKQMCNRVRDLSTSGSSSTSDSASSSNFSSTSCNDTVNNSDVQTNVIINEPSTSNLTSQVTGSCASKLSYFTPPHISIPTKVM